MLSRPLKECDWLAGCLIESLSLTKQHRLVSNLQSSCLSSGSARIIDIHLQTQPNSEVIKNQLHSIPSQPPNRQQQCVSDSVDHKYILHHLVSHTLEDAMWMPILFICLFRYPERHSHVLGPNMLIRDPLQNSPH